MRILPTDLQILNTIYNQYYDKFISFSKNDSDRSSKILIPIDITLIAKKLKVDVDIIFGRLYYHLEQKYGYKRSADAKVAFFALQDGANKNCINFPYMASVLANLREREKKYSIATSITILSLIIAILSLIIAGRSLLFPIPG
ncbi:MAG TPA: hypothetical protein VFD10_02725 [Atribacterota bacterium]|nr:hypothetical protein [Atribacterota bacterium]